MSRQDRLPEPRRLGRPLYRPLWALAASGFVGALATDVAYWLTADFLWVDFSDWLVSAGVVIGVVAAVVGVIERIARRAILPRRPAASIVLDLVAWALGVLDMLFHTRDGWTSVVPWGLALSAAVVAVLILSEIVSRTAPAPALAQRVV